MAKKMITKMLSKKNVREDEILCICPFNKYLVELNIFFQNKLHPLSESRKGPKGIRWMVGDKVMMTCNNYDAGLLNGDIGIIISFKDELHCCKAKIRFDINDHWFKMIKGRGGEESKQYVRSNQMTMDMCVLAYAISVHRSQGSEANNVIFVIPYVSKFINRNLFYTGMTRSKKSFWLLCDVDKLKNSISDEVEPTTEYLGLALTK
jgi:exodeoxyribonuclease V alpha subunit